MIRAGFGIGFGPAWLGREDWERGTIVETLRDWRDEEAKLYAVRIDKRLTPLRVHTVQEFIVDVTRKWHDEFTHSDLAVHERRIKRGKHMPAPRWPLLLLSCDTASQGKESLRLGPRPLPSVDKSRKR